MGEEVRCDVCGKEGRRGRSKHCPVGWFYGESIVENKDGSQDAEADTHISWVCSEECSKNFWCKGPGDLKTSPAYILQRRADIKAEEDEMQTEDAKVRTEPQ